MVYNEKQIQILEEAERLFSEKGFNGTSIREIAQAADINLAMVSYYFGSKNKLLEAIFIYRGNNTQTTLLNLESNKALSSLQKIDKLIEHYVDRVIEKNHFYKILSREMVVNSTPEMDSLILGIKKQNLSIIKQIIAVGQKEGSFKKNIDIPLLINTLSGTANSLIASQRYYKIMSGLEETPEAEFQKLLVRKLIAHLKTIFKTLIVNEI
ncbi:MAG: TetR family transcriptional regulator [Chitinophagaceae bacterium]|jgi:AcrR family transcriptional regulator|nr:TetR/AcrR family transcriptional regulator [Chitinophagaceae bacterium]MBP9740115.1 TetR/AcrR family transcriptional regulator [Chitinophagaceae bacterium]